MNRFTIFCCLLFFLSSGALAQKRMLPVDTTITTSHQVTIKGATVPYTATVGTQPVWNSDDEVIASLFYTYYERTDIENRTARPLVISFNGGPGSASVWMHIGYTGPKMVLIDDEGFPVQPYGVEDNPHSILDVADIVFVDPVNTGFSRIVGDADREQFFGVQEDVQYLAGWLDNWVSRHERWNSPKVLIGESYGTTRVAALAGQLQNRHWMYLNGVILVSPTPMGGSARTEPVSSALKLPYYAATAWYHNALEPALQSRDLDDILPEVEAYAIEELLPALSRGGFLEEAQKQEIAQSYSRYSGLSVDAIMDHNLIVPTSFFWKDLLREEGITIGRLDSRYRGRDRSDAGIRYDHDPALTSWNHSFTPAINHYLRDQLGVKTDLQYWIFGPVHPWNRDNNSAGEDLRQAMAQNPYLHVMIQAGYFDGGTDYFSAKYTMWNMDPSGRLTDRLSFKGYRSGHMMYLRKEDLASSNEHIREFIQQAVQAGNQSAKY